MSEFVSKDEAVKALKEGKVLYEENNDRYYWLQEVSVPVVGDCRVVMATDNMDIDNGDVPTVYGWVDSFLDDPLDREICNFDSEGEKEMAEQEDALTPTQALEKMLDGYLVTDTKFTYGIGKTTCTDNVVVDVVLTYFNEAFGEKKPPFRISTLYEWAMSTQGDKKFWVERQILTADDAYELLQKGSAIESIDTGYVYYVRDLELYDGTICKEVFRFPKDEGLDSVEIYWDWETFKLDPSRKYKVYKMENHTKKETEQ